MRLIPERLFDKIEFEPMSGCWLWVGYVMPNGYGQAWRNGRVTSAHRVIYECAVGPVSPSLVLDHLCRTPQCVNPRHLDPVTDKVNLARGKPGEMAARSQCSVGHPFDSENTYVNPASRGRRCRACRHKYMAVYGRSPSPDRQRRVLTAADARAIRVARATGHTLVMLAKEYGISVGMVHQIAVGKKWKLA